MKSGGGLWISIDGRARLTMPFETSRIQGTLQKAGDFRKCPQNLQCVTLVKSSAAVGKTRCVLADGARAARICQKIGCVWDPPSRPQTKYTDVSRCTVIAMM